MVLSILLSIGTISFNAADINKSGDSGSSKVTADIEEARFSVTVPTVLPIAVDADNNVTVADNAVVRNNNNGPIEITDISVKATGGWSLVGFNTDFTKRPVNTKEYGMVINATDTTSDGKILAECFSTIDGGGTHKVDYDGNVAIQSKSTKNLHIGNVIFTVGWKTVPVSTFESSFSQDGYVVSPSPISQELSNAKNFEKSEEILSLEQIKQKPNATKVDDGVTKYSIYTYSEDTDDTLYWWSDADIVKLPEDCSFLFTSLYDVEYLDLSNFDTSNVKHMNNMFNSCVFLKDVNLSSFNTSNVVDMDYMFYNCYSLTELDLTNFDTSKATNVGCMFFNCNYLTRIYASDKFILNDATDGVNMFWCCNVLKGGKGTPWDKYHMGKEYARIDGKDNLPGYFTEKAA